VLPANKKEYICMALFYRQTGCY